uniref:Uncharacterized protein n=1 Tax=Anguilla anguilla TaxID=7936 RepID=A0A0E9V5I6_ANGAN
MGGLLHLNIIDAMSQLRRVLSK